ncbi:SDR family NAD(P)-dependent oxidoreductase [Robertkochia marina]|uniref:SDR family NAD(P)-dependent oxidoreductase n=1 Tax=Robertkochia marina TaxID=1227945 RepID=A0A4S3M455_9FLAO|nr:SDR family NAD(P)-dependent oxidoreductase [Robertkochia marina]THD69469.1 SDR family NAD(P)-dependent oxidoreductase [Robertkochia marina]TRZ47271.1 SDR family NAD(P)-dependent oxidoreductase [Robertkochia marina]
MKTAMITGATSGIGKAIAYEFGKQGLRLILCGRRSERLEELKKELSAITEVTTLRFDVRDREKVLEAVSSLDDSFSTIDILVNNAGNAHGLDPIDEGNPDDWDAMMDINVKGLLYVTHAVLPKMKAQKSGQIINIGSTAGKEVYPKGNVYCASKHAVDAINQGMRLDLNGTNIRVGAINPGLVETEFSEVRFKGDKEKASKVYEGYTPLSPEDVAEIAWFMVSRPPHVNIADLVVMCTDQASSTIVNKNP